jgi:fructose-1,6-bisphosphatase/inositol monophosphatase family enzyme
LIEDRVVTSAAIGIGKTGEILWAERGRGAHMRTGVTDRAIAVSDASNTIWIDGHTAHAANAMRDAMVLNRWYVWKFSSSLAYAYLACGKIAAAIQIGSNPAVIPYGSVHSAAGCFIAREAGAILTHVDGTAWELGKPSFLMAATAALHRDLSVIVANAPGTVNG